MLKKIENYLKNRAGIPTPTAETWSGWRRHDEEYKNKAPLTHAVFNIIDYIDTRIHWWIVNPVTDFFYGIRCRFISRPWMADSKLNRYQWMDKDTLILHSNFETLVDYVEVELATYGFGRSTDNKLLELWNHVPILRFFRPETRNVQHGLNYLRWCAKLAKPYSKHYEESYVENGKAKEGSQPWCAEEAFELYKWWKKIRPKRPDPHDAGGWTEYCKRKRDSGQDLLDDDNQDDTSEIHKKCFELEQQYEKEDTEMLIRLIKIRKSLWV
jgi:hypothetical protein